MAISFGFDRNFDTNAFLSWGSATSGAGPFQGIDVPSRLHYVGADDIRTPDDEVLVPIALFAGQNVQLDIDFGQGAGDDNIDTQVFLIDALGNQVAVNDDSPVDSGSVSALDSFLSFTATTAGLYYVAVSGFNNDYIDGTFTFEDDGGTGGQGDFQLDISTNYSGFNFQGTNADDSSNFDFDNSNDRAFLLGGDDFYNAGGGQNAVDGGAGDDTIIGGIAFPGQNQFFGGDGDDSLVGSASGFSDVLVGGNGDDTLIGQSGDDQLFGGEGNDDLDGGNDNDVLFGERGDDLISGGAGSDFMSGGSGDDTVSFLDSSAAVSANIGSGQTATSGADTDTVAGFHNAIGSNFDDFIRGRSTDNTLIGNDGDDTLSGVAGDDFLDGGNGNDRLVGGAGDDILDGGAGGDVLLGRGGSDTFHYDDIADSGTTSSTRDVIRAFVQGTDIVDLQDIDADTTASGNQAFDFIGFTGFSGHAGELRVNASGNVALGDVDGDGVADFAIRVAAVSLVEGDFLL